MNNAHVVHEINRQSQYLSRKCPIRLQPFMIGDQVIVCQGTGTVFSVEGFNEFIGDWQGSCPYCKHGIDIQSIPEEYEPKTDFSKNRTDITEVEPEDIGPLGLFWVKNGSRRGQYYKINHGTTIGRK